MTGRLLLFGLFSATLFLHGCKRASADDLKIRNEQSLVQNQPDDLARADNAAPKTERPRANSQTVNFKGVSFNYNPQIFGAVETEEVTEDEPLYETEKPGENFPKHLEFYFKQTNAANHSTDKGRIAVVSLENYRRMFAASNEMTEGFDENLKNLRKVLANKNFRHNGEIPFMPFYDAHQYFVAKVEHISFQNGKSLCFLTQYMQESYLINNEDISYYCQGMTNDGKNYFLAVFTVNVSFLPKDYYAKEFEDYKIPQTSWNKKEAEQYKNYISKTTRRLEDLPSDKYEPNLKFFEEIISSLKIEQ